MQSIRMRCLFAFVVVAFCLVANNVQSAIAADQPNIIYFLADDLGWADVGWHGSEIKTPNLDKLANGGAKLEQLKRYAHLTDKKRQVYASMVECLDDQVGRVVAALEQRGLTDNTLILFSSDNGGLPGVGGAANGKLRGQKGTLYEGGTRVCAFANWPGHLKPGTVVTEPLHIVDWFPTLVNLAGGSLQQQHPLDGRDLWPVLTAGKPSPHEDILINAMPNSGAIRMGGWKLVVNGHITANDLENAGAKKAAPGRNQAPENAADSVVELFNLTEDPYEQNNLAAQNPEKVRQLRARLEAYRAAAVPPKAENQPANHKAPRVWGQ
jgi:arylsulfatase A-like enzyme